jgi:uncharacterized protein (UPF0254 family)
LATLTVIATIFVFGVLNKNDQQGALNGGGVSAQEVEKATKKEKITDPESYRSVDERNSETVAILDKKELKLDLNQAPIEEFVEQLRRDVGVQVNVDIRNMVDSGIQMDTVKFDTKLRARAKTCLQMALKEHNLNYMIDDGIVIITTDEQVQAKFDETIRIYSRDKVFAQIEAREVYSLVTSAVRKNSWVCNGGRGVINVLPDRIVIAQSSEVHAELAKFWKQNSEIDTIKDLKTFSDTFTESDQLLADSATLNGLGGFRGTKDRPLPGINNAGIKK